MGKPLTLSIIIPAYNEENHLRACLEAVKNQTVKPLEVLLIDNNSTDRTREIAEEYDFVTILSEKRQGLIPARNKGLNIAKGCLLARLDADSVLDDNWVEKALEVFEDTEIMAITGPAKTFLVPYPLGPHSTFWSRVYFLHMLSVLRFRVLWGPNMVIRREVWKDIKAQACLDDKEVHEDQDLSILIKSMGHKIAYRKDLLITTDGERLAYLPKGIEYQHRKQSTIKRHKSLGTLKQAQQDGLSRPLAWMLFVALLPLGVVYLVLSGVYSLEKKLGWSWIE